MAEGHIGPSLLIPRPQPGVGSSQGFPEHWKASHWLMDSVLGQSTSLDLLWDLVGSSLPALVS